MKKTLQILLMFVACSLWGCSAALLLWDDDDDVSGDDDDATGDDDDATDDDDDATDDDDDATDDDDDATGIDEALLCGPEPDLSNAGSEIYTGEFDVEVNAQWQHHWRWDGCESSFYVGAGGQLDCGTRYEVSGESAWEDPNTASYGMDLQFVVDHDTCGDAENFWVQFAVEDVSGSWSMFEIWYSYGNDWYLLTSSAPGMINWDGGGQSGVGWIEYESIN